MLIHPTLVLCIGERAKPLVNRLARWTTDELRRAFIFESFASGTITAEDICIYARTLTQALPELETAGLTEVSAIQDFRVLFAFETVDLPLVDEALHTVHSAHRLLREQGGAVLGLSCILLAFGPDEKGAVPQLLSSLVVPSDVVWRRTLFYLSDWRGVVSTYSDDLRNAAEISVALILLGDLSPDGRLAEFWRDADRQAYWVGLEQFRFKNQDEVVAQILSQTLTRRVASLCGGQPPSQSDYIAIIKSTFGFYPNSERLTTSSLEATQLRDRYSQATDKFIERSARYVSDIPQLARLISELAEMTKLRPLRDSVESSAASMPRETRGRTSWAALLLWLKHFFFSGKSIPANESSPQNDSSLAVGSIRNPVLSSFLSELAGTLSFGRAQEIFRPDYGTALPSDNLCLDFILSGDARSELLGVAEGELNVATLNLFQLLAIDSLIDSGAFINRVREADEHRTRIVLAIRKQLRQLWLANCIQEHSNRRISGRWLNYLFCNAPPPAPELFEIALDSARDRPATAMLHPALLPPSLLFYLTFVRI
jgi:hypothetical protein